MPDKNRHYKFQMEITPGRQKKSEIKKAKLIIEFQNQQKTQKQTLFYYYRNYTIFILVLCLLLYLFITLIKTSPTI